MRELKAQLTKALDTLELKLNRDRDAFDCPLCEQTGNGTGEHSETCPIGELWQIVNNL